MRPRDARPPGYPAFALAAGALTALLTAACGTNPPPASVPSRAPAAILTATPYARPPQPIIVDASGAISGGQPDVREVPYRVEAGDTLLGIAIRFDTTIEAIVRRNSLPNASDLKIGQDLIVPTNAVIVATAVPTMTATAAARTPTPVSAATPSGTSTPGATPAAGTPASGTPAPGSTVVVGGARTYIVDAGDTGSAIANRFGVTTQALADANNRTIAALGDIRPGDRLVIPPAR